MANEASDISGEPGFPKLCFTARGGVYREGVVNSRVELDAFISRGEGHLLAVGMRSAEPNGRHARH